MKTISSIPHQQASARSRFQLRNPPIGFGASSVERRASNGGEAAFSMIEIALSLAIIGIALVSILGLLAVGLNSARDATDDNMAAQIVQAIIADRQSAPYDQNTPPINATGTTFAIPRLDTGTFPYALFFKKSGGMPINTGGFQSQQAGYYYEVDVKKNPASPTGLALLDIRVSWPASAPMTRRFTYFCSTAITTR